MAGDDTRSDPNNQQPLGFLALLDELPADERLAVRMRHLDRQPLDRIAARCGCSPSQAAGLLKRGVGRLRAKLSKPNQEAKDGPDRPA